jgi:hypothetical protein
MRAVLRIGPMLVGLLAVAVLGHVALTTGMRVDGPVGRFAAGTCSACH